MTYISCKLIELCAFKIENKRAYFLLLHRMKDEKSYPNIWQFITGYIKKSEKANDAAVRELNEETGLVPINLWIVPYTFAFYNPQNDSLNVSPFFAAQVKHNSSVKLSREHNDYGWFTLKEAKRKLILPAWKEGLQIVDDYIIHNNSVATFSKIR